MADFRKGKKTAQRNWELPGRFGGGDERSNWSPRNSVDCNLSADGSTETHRNSSNFGSETLVTHGSHPQEILLFAQVEIVDSPGYSAASFFLTSGAPKNSQAPVSDEEKMPYIQIASL